MALPLTGPISLDDVNVELGTDLGTLAAMGSPTVRGLFLRTTGLVSMSHGYGQANSVGSWLSTTSLFGSTAHHELKNGWGAQNSSGDTLLSTFITPDPFGFEEEEEGGAVDPQRPYTGLGFILRDKDGTKLLQSSIDVSTVNDWEDGCKGSLDDNRNIYLAYNDDEVAGRSALVVLKLNSSGVIQWQKSWPQHGKIYDLTVSGSGVIYIAGLRTSTNSVVSNRAQITKINTNGTLQWVRLISSANNSLPESGYKIIVAPSGNIFMSTNHSNSGGNLYEFNPAGVMQGTGISFTEVSGAGVPFTIDSNGNIYSFHYINPPEGGGQRAIVMKMNSAGVIQTAWRCGTRNRFMVYGDLAFNETTGHLAIVSSASNVPALPFSHSGTCVTELNMTTGTQNFAYNIRAQYYSTDDFGGEFLSDGELNGHTMFNSDGGSYHIMAAVGGHPGSGGEYHMQIDPNDLPVEGTFGLVELDGADSRDDQPMVTLDAVTYTWVAEPAALNQGTISRTASSVTLGAPTNQSFSVEPVTVAVDNYYTISSTTP
tara:strand:- start:249 stop:1868 length:1620 start_codon:yes stop_codon:yes gene_type:complete